MVSSAQDMWSLLVQELARAVACELRGGGEASGGGSLPPSGGEWIDQQQSPLGAKLHNAAVRRRLAEGKGGAVRRNRRHLLTPEALREEMMRSPKPGLRKAAPRPAAPPPGKDSVAQATLARLRLIRGQPPKKG